MEKYPRRCDATGKGIWEGYVVGDGELYFSTQELLIEYLKELDWEDCDGKRSQDLTNDEDILEFFYNEDHYYYSEWDKYDIDDVYYDEDGNEYEKQ